MYDLIVKFRVKLAGLIPRREDWVDFYTKNQVFVTLCQNCVALKDIRQYLESSKNLHQSDKTTSLEFAKLIKEGEGKTKKLYKDIIKNDIKGTFKAIMLNWISMSRSNLLHLRPQGYIEDQPKAKVHEKNKENSLSEIV